MESSHYRKIDLQSPADFTYLHGNAVALSRQKLDLHLPPSANPDDEPDPMRERVRELVNDFINRTFSSASASIAINGLDSSSPEFPFPEGLTAPAETVEYEPYDAKLAARVSSLYAQLESLTTTVAQLRRDAPGKAARQYAEQLNKAIEEDDRDVEGEQDDDDSGEDQGINTNIEIPDAAQPQSEDPVTASAQRRPLMPSTKSLTKWHLDIPLGTGHEAKRWHNGEIAEVYEDALRMLLRLQGEAVPADSAVIQADGLDGNNALSSTVGKTERATRAVEFVEKV
ncbi:kinetochore protein Mis14 like-domain-containing protein [Aspergillus heterothallicus]